MIYLFIFSIIMFLCIPTMAVDFLVNNSGLQHNEKKKEINSAMFLCRAFGVFLIVMLLYYWKKFIVIPLTILLELSVDNVKTKLVLSFIIVLFGLIYYLFFWFSKDNNYAI